MDHSGKAAGWAWLIVALTMALMVPLALTADEEEPLDELTVLGERSLRSLYNEMISVQDQVFALLNELLDDEFHVVCRHERPTGSHISRRVCRTRYAEEAVRNQSLAMLEGWDYDPVPVIQEKNLLMEEEIARAIRESDGLAEAYRAYHRLQEEYARRASSQ